MEQLTPFNVAKELLNTMTTDLNEHISGREIKLVYLALIYMAIESIHHNVEFDEFLEIKKSLIEFTDSFENEQRH